jgi:hypothetical protein
MSSVFYFLLFLCLPIDLSSMRDIFKLISLNELLIIVTMEEEKKYLND